VATSAENMHHESSVLCSIASGAGVRWNGREYQRRLCRNLIGGMLRRIEAVIKARGTNKVLAKSQFIEVPNW